MRSGAKLALTRNIEKNILVKIQGEERILEKMARLFLLYYN
jgi:hypothetical protein